MSRVGRRYAKAIFELAREERQLGPVGEQLTAVAGLVQNPELAGILSNPLVSSERRRALAGAIEQQLGLLPMVSRFLRMLADRARLDQLSSIADHYQRLEDEALNRVRLRIRSATALDDEQRRRVVGAFEQGLGRTVVPQEEVDDDLLGGVVVEAEGKVYDGSVRTRLERLAKQIARADIHS